MNTNIAISIFVKIDVFSATDKINVFSIQRKDCDSVKINGFSTSVKTNINVFITSVKIYVLLQRCFQVVVEPCRGWTGGAIDISRTASPPKMFKRC